MPGRLDRLVMALLQNGRQLARFAFAFGPSRSLIVIGTTCASLYGGTVAVNAAARRWPLPEAVMSVLQILGLIAMPSNSIALQGISPVLVDTQPNAMLVVTVDADPPSGLWIVDERGQGVGQDPASGLSRLEMNDAQYSGHGTNPQEIDIAHATGSYSVQILSPHQSTYRLTARLELYGIVTSSDQANGQSVPDRPVQFVANVGPSGDLHLQQPQRPSPRGPVAPRESEKIDKPAPASPTPGPSLAPQAVPVGGVRVAPAARSQPSSRTIQRPSPAPTRGPALATGGVAVAAEPPPYPPAALPAPANQPPQAALPSPPVLAVPASPPPPSPTDRLATIISLGQAASRSLKIDSQAVAVGSGGGDGAQRQPHGEPGKAQGHSDQSEGHGGGRGHGKSHGDH